MVHFVEVLRRVGRTTTWDRWAALALLLYFAAALGVRPGTAAHLASGARLALLTDGVLLRPDRRADDAVPRLLDHLLAARPADRRWQQGVGWWLVAAWQARRDPRAEQRALALLRDTGRPELPEPASRLAWFMQTAGRQREAAAAYELLLFRGLADRATDRYVRLALANLYSLSGQAASAELMFRGLYQQFPADPEILNSFAWHYAQTGRELAFAEHTARRAVTLLRRRLWWRPWARRREREALGMVVDTLGWVHYRQDRLKDAEPLLREAVGLTAERHPDVLVHLAQVLYDRGQDQAASDLVDKALRLSPEFGPAQQLHQQLRGGPRPPGEIG